MTRLGIKVRAQNRVNHAANLFAQQAVRIFRPLIGTKILTADCTLIKKVAALVPGTVEDKVDVIPTNQHPSLVFKLRCCEWATDADKMTNPCDKGYTYYAEQIVWVGKCEGTTLSEVFLNPGPYPVQYTEAKILQARFRVRELIAKLDAAKGACQPFGLNDF